MFTKLKQTVYKHSVHILTATMFTMAIWLNIYAVEPYVTSAPDSIDEPTKKSEIIEFLNSPKKHNADKDLGKQAISSNSEFGLYFSSNSEVEQEEATLQEPLTGPKLYLSYVDQITTEVYPDIPADYIKAMIWRESRYEPNCKTGNHVGLMQISTKWHTQRAKSLGVDDLYDPYGNILVGCDILNEFTQSNDFRYALNYFAGGYKYANSYKNSKSPVEKELDRIVEQMNNGDIVIGGE